MILELAGPCSNAMNERVDLESKIAQLERTVDSLSGELHAQQQQVEALHAARVLSLKLRLALLMDTLMQAPGAV